MNILAALISGLIFGLGLVVSQMIDPAKIIAFLDLAGSWDPSLACVMAGAVPVAAIGYALARRRPRPLFADTFRLPVLSAIDARLIGGAVLFGVGWGLAGYCPGPAVAAIGIGRPSALIFVLAMLVGMALHELPLLLARRPSSSEV
jgi:uncharacterized membrane protein YedE/YeeE